MSHPGGILPAGSTHAFPLLPAPGGGGPPLKVRTRRSTSHELKDQASWIPWCCGDKAGSVPGLEEKRLTGGNRENGGASRSSCTNLSRDEWGGTKHRLSVPPFGPLRLLLFKILAFHWGITGTQACGKSREAIFRTQRSTSHELKDQASWIPWSCGEKAGPVPGLEEKRLTGGNTENGGASHSSCTNLSTLKGR